MKVVVGLSGGVDSSVAAYLLREQGHEVIGLFMRNWHDTTGKLEGECSWHDDQVFAELVAKRLDTAFHYVDLSKEYKQRVVDYMFSEYEKGRTPNPDVLCNREIKFDVFLQEALKLGAEAVATGHYCRKEERIVDGKTVYSLLAGSDPNKDQSYFLCQLSQEQLKYAMFPIGHLLKPEVRRIAEEQKLATAKRKDSQGICFVGKVDLPTFLQQKLKPCEGDIVEVYDAYYAENQQYSFIKDTLSKLMADGGDVKMITDYVSEDKAVAAETSGCLFSMESIAGLSDEDFLRLSQPVTYDIRFETETYRSGRKHIRKTRYKENPFGKIVGRHDGAQFYTIGQRKGLNVGGHKDSIFVIETDIPDNIIYVGEGHTHKGLSRSCLRVAPDEIHWIRKDLAMVPGEIRRYRVRIRYRQPLQDATVIMRENGLYILFDQPQRGITPGQFAVWYDGDEMLGSGVI